jgi:hypothetical protein
MDNESLHRREFLRFQGQAKLLLDRPEEADRPRTASDFPLGDRAHDQQRLGDPVRRPFSTTAAWAAALWTYAKQGSGLRMGGGSHRGVLPRGADSLYRVAGTHTKTRSAKSARRPSQCGEES